MTIGDPSAEAVALFDKFVSANTCHSILAVFQQLCDCLEIHPLDEGWFYQTLKSKLTHWKAVSLWNKLDKRFNHKEYSNHKACSNTRVLVIGAGPCGLRSAIECKLLGARVVLVEKRDGFSRNNVLHLWPFVIHDLKSLGAKAFYPKFCAGSIDHISIRQLQCVLMKISLLLGVEIYTNTSYDDLLEPSPPSADPEQKGWRAKVSPPDHPVSCYEFDVLIGADGKRNTLQGFSRKEFRGKLAIAITANFINHQTTEEQRVEEISGVAFIFNQKFFKDLTAQTGIDLENIVYYKDATHYFVMTAKKHSLLEKGVLLQDHRDTIKLLSRDNVNQEALQNYAREAADVSTNHKLPNLQFAHNQFGQPDIAMFDFTSLFAADYSSRAMERYGRKLLVTIVGDSLLEPFWPTGSGCARGFLACLDSAWAVKSWASGAVSPLQVLAERESVYMLLSQTTAESLSKSFNSYTINPITRYKHCNTQALKCIQVRQLYDTTETINLNDLEPVEIPAKRARTYDIMADQNRLLRWCNKKFLLLPSEVRCEVHDLTSSWKDGRLFSLLIHLYAPDKLPVDNLEDLSVLNRLTNAFNVAEFNWGILPMLTPEEIMSSEEPDKLFMVSYITQFYTALRDKRPLGAAPEFLASPGGKVKHSVSPSAAKISTLKRLGKIIGSGGKGTRRRRPSSSQKSPRAATGPKSPHNLHSPTASNRKPSHPKVSKHAPTSPEHASAVSKQGKLDSGTFDMFINPAKHKNESRKEQRAPGTDAVKTRMKEIRDAFSLKNKRQKVAEPPPKKKTALREEWVASKDEKLEEYDQRFKEFSRRMEPGNIGNTNPGKRGSNLVSEFASMFEKGTPEASPVLHRKPRVAEGEGGLDALLNREPKPNELCYFCKKRIYVVERQSAEGMFFHRSCFKCYYCEVSLHISNYTLHRTPLGQGRFYCDQHVGKERRTPTKRSSELIDSRSSSTKFNSDVSASNSKEDSLHKFATPERVEFENSVDYLDEDYEDAEEMQFQHNLGTLSPSTADEIRWSAESDSDDGEFLDDKEGATSTGNTSWKGKQRLHDTESNGSETTLTSVTTATSSSTDQSARSSLLHPDTDLVSSSVTPAKTRLSANSTASVGKEEAPCPPPVSVLKQPISVLKSTADTKPSISPRGASRATAWAKQQQEISPNTQSSSAIQEINKRKSNFFAQTAEPVRLDARAVLEPHPSSTPTPNLSTVNISLGERYKHIGDTLLFKKKNRESRKSGEQFQSDSGVRDEAAAVEVTGVSNEQDKTDNAAANQTVEDVVTSADKSFTQGQVIADTLVRRRKSRQELKRNTTPEIHIESDEESEHEYDNVAQLIAAGVTRSAEHVTRRKPRPHTISLAARGLDDHVEESDSESSFTISTPSDGELDGMSTLGTLRSDGKLSSPRREYNSTPILTDSSFSDDEETFYTPMLNYATNKLQAADTTTPKSHRAGDMTAPKLRRGAMKGPKALTNPTYELHAVGPTNRLNRSDGSSIYSTPCAPAGVVRQSGLELDGSFQKMCLSDELPLASDEDDDAMYLTEEELSDSSQEPSESDSDDGLSGTKKLSPEKIQNAAARQHKRDEMKRLRIAQEIQRQLQEVEVKTKALETEGVELEKSLRKQQDPNSAFNGQENKEVMQRWFNVIHNKSQLYRYESELMVRAKELELEDRHSRLTNEMRKMLLKPESEKSHEEKIEENTILQELLEAVKQRDELVNMLEVDRLKEKHEDEQLQNVMLSKGFELSPVPYTQVTMKKGYKGRQSRRLLSQCMRSSTLLKFLQKILLLLFLASLYIALNSMPSLYE
ncbi:protein-methionine sulfoxide oxidase mical3b-like isoform X3 [Watersipora subatra]|uniref:protein-methionine sulfoxide oxidase mical3b-like isoform X3 n=1 Tax=Watersipora subatra TaxID=2589382 RepID=UPI00355C3F68